MVRVFQHRLMPALVEAYAATPPRLVAALTAATELLDFSIAQVAEQYLEERTRQLEATNREIEAFNYSVAHDLRAPLRSVSGFTQILLEDFAPRLDRDAVNYLTKIQGGVTRMTTLIDALLELAQLARNEIDVRPVNLTAVARTVVGQLAGVDPRRKIDVNIQAGLHTVADGRLVRTLLENLIGKRVEVHRQGRRAPGRGRQQRRPHVLRARQWRGLRHRAGPQAVLAVRAPARARGLPGYRRRARHGATHRRPPRWPDLGPGPGRRRRDVLFHARAHDGVVRRQVRVESLTPTRRCATVERSRRRL